MTPSLCRRPAYSLLAALCALLAGCTGAPQYRHAEGAVWNTTYHITYLADTDLGDSIPAVMRRVGASLSPFEEGSLVSAVNRGEPAAADSMLRCVMERSRWANSVSHGAFDPTVAPLVNLWGYGYRDTGIEPTQQAIDSMLALVGIGECSVRPDGTLAKKHPATEFNFSAIAKGYGCDMVGRMLERNGCTDYMVEIGGEVAVRGQSPRRRPWRIMVDAPVDCDTAVVHQRLAVIEVTDCGVATSGNYRNYREKPDGRTWHTISPVTGRPAVTDLLSATVIAPDCMTADALATACMAQPSAAALGMITRVGAQALLVTRDTTLYTPGFPLAQ